MIREVKHIIYPVVKNASGHYERGSEPDTYIVRIDDSTSNPDHLVFILNGYMVSKKVVIDESHEHVFKNMKTMIKAIGGARELFRWFEYQFDGDGPFQCTARHLIERIIEQGATA